MTGLESAAVACIAVYAAFVFCLGVFGCGATEPAVDFSDEHW